MNDLARRRAETVSRFTDVSKRPIMDRGKKREEITPIILRAERRARKSRELSCEEIMEIVRKRGSRTRGHVIDVDELP